MALLSCVISDSDVARVLIAVDAAITSNVIRLNSSGEIVAVELEVIGSKLASCVSDGIS